VAKLKLMALVSLGNPPKALGPGGAEAAQELKLWADWCERPMTPEQLRAFQTLRKFHPKDVALRLMYIPGYEPPEAVAEAPVDVKALTPAEKAEVARLSKVPGLDRAGALRVQPANQGKNII